MPVLGHAFVGLGTAVAGAPAQGTPRRSFLWVPTIIALSYLPDIVAQVLGMAGLVTWRNVAHSLLLTFPIALVLTPVLVWLFGLTGKRAFVVALVCILLHSLLDGFFGGKYMLLWPITSAREGPAVGHEYPLPLESVIFPGAFVLFYVAWRWETRKAGRSTLATWAGTTRKQRWGGAVLSIMITMVAATTYGLSLLRHHQATTADRLTRQGNYVQALKYIDMASQWPAAQPFSHFENQRAHIYLKMGDRTRAEQYWLNSYASDPSNYWTVVSLANFYASAPAPLEWRKAKAEPYLHLLSTKFADRPEVVRYERRIVSKLQSPPSTHPETRAGTTTGLKPPPTADHDKSPQAQQERRPAMMTQRRSPS